MLGPFLGKSVTLITHTNKLSKAFIEVLRVADDQLSAFDWLLLLTLLFPWKQ